jgi:hypothetical protein
LQINSSSGEQYEDCFAAKSKKEENRILIEQNKKALKVLQKITEWLLKKQQRLGIRPLSYDSAKVDSTKKQ